MISGFFIKNYKSVLEEKVNFSFAEGKAPNGYKDADYFTFLSSKKGRCVPALAIFGANGSGKSNLLEAIDTLSCIISEGSIAGKYRPNKLNRKFNTTILSLDFFVDDNFYVYSIEYDEYKIKEEYLKKNDKLLFKADGTEIKSDILNREQRKNVNRLFNDSCLDQRVFVHPLLTMVKKWLSGLSDVTLVYDYLRSIVYMKSNNIPSFVSIDLLSMNKQDTNASFKEIVSYLQKMDINVTDAEMDLQRILNRTQHPDGRVISRWEDQITVYHPDIDGTKVGLKLTEESQGTRLLFGILGAVLLVLKEGRVLFSDELDRSLHPFVLRALTRLFKDKSINTKNAQLVYSAHDTSIFEDELLRISEAALVTNTLKEGTTIKRLSDYEGISNADNFRKLYVDGRLGAVPATRN